MNDWEDFVLTQTNWKLVEAVVELLRHFWDTVKLFKAEVTPIMHRVIERIYKLNETLKDFIDKNQGNKSALKFGKS